MKIHSALLAGAAFFTLSGAALAGEPTGPYVGIAAGWDSVNTLKVSVPGTSPTKIGVNDGALYVLSGGYRFEEHFRLEAELNYSPHEPADGYSGHATVLGGMINALYDIPLTPDFGMALGGGLGIGNGELKSWGTNHSTGYDSQFNDSKNFLQWQLIAEAHYTLAPQVELFANYRYRGLQLNNAKFAGSAYNGAQYASYGAVHNMRDNAVLIGLRFFFNDQSEKPVAMAPAPMMVPSAPPPPPPVAAVAPVTTYIVFFDFAQSDLTDQSKQVVADAVRTAKTNGFVTIKVVGHADTVGGDKFNMALSEKRAAVVKAAMANEGLAPDTIAVEGKGFHDPLVATGMGVKEPQNRRAVIDFGK
ncbi:MAG: OmpA family protein [Rhizomicrobium sp.]